MHSEDDSHPENLHINQSTGPKGLLKTLTSDVRNSIDGRRTLSIQANNARICSSLSPIGRHPP